MSIKYIVLILSFSLVSCGTAKKWDSYDGLTKEYLAVIQAEFYESSLANPIKKEPFGLIEVQIHKNSSKATVREVQNNFVMNFGPYTQNRDKVHSDWNFLLSGVGNNSQIQYFLFVSESRQSIRFIKQTKTEKGIKVTYREYLPKQYLICKKIQEAQSKSRFNDFLSGLGGVMKELLLAQAKYASGMGRETYSENQLNAVDRFVDGAAGSGSYEYLLSKNGCE